MNKTHKNATLIIIVSSILVAILFDIKTIIHVLEQLESKRLFDLEVRSMIRVHFGFLNFVSHILIFSSLPTTQ